MNLYLVKSRTNNIVELVGADSAAEAENLVAEAHGLEVGHKLYSTLKQAYYYKWGIVSNAFHGEQYEKYWR